MKIKKKKRTKNMWQWNTVVAQRKLDYHACKCILRIRTI